MGQTDEDSSSESTSCQSTDTADDACVQTQRGPTWWNTSSENVDADMWNALENLQNSDATASDVNIPLLHAAYDEGANKWCKSEVSIFGPKWNACVD
jgi:hypothetical protein